MACEAKDFLWWPNSQILIAGLLNNHPLTNHVLFCHVFPSLNMLITNLCPQHFFVEFSSTLRGEYWWCCIFQFDCLSPQGASGNEENKRSFFKNRNNNSLILIFDAPSNWPPRKQMRKSSFTLTLVSLNTSCYVVPILFSSFKTSRTQNIGKGIPVTIATSLHLPAAADAPHIASFGKAHKSMSLSFTLFLDQWLLHRGGRVRSKPCLQSQSGTEINPI